MRSFETQIAIFDFNTKDGLADGTRDIMFCDIAYNNIFNFKVVGAGFGMGIMRWCLLHYYFILVQIDLILDGTCDFVSCHQSVLSSGIRIFIDY